jgi:putative membrane protein
LADDLSISSMKTPRVESAAITAAVRLRREREAEMIRDYTNHAANERTYLAWVRTGIAVMALGFVIEKFNLFVLTVGGSIALSGAVGAQVERRLEHLSGPLGREGGGVLVLGGVALIAIATWRFIHTRRLLDDSQTHSARVGRIELIALAALLLIVAGFGAFLAVS